MPVSPPTCDFGWKAPDFDLPSVDGRNYALQGVAGKDATLVMFICNHCPYVTGIVDRLVADVKELIDVGVGVAAICSNDADAYPDDSFDNMRKFAGRHGFPFPYLHDESQAVAKAYDAACTPDFFGFDAGLGLQFRGRIDAAGRNPRPEGMKRELVEAMQQIVRTGEGPENQIPSMGCSIKWK